MLEQVTNKIKVLPITILILVAEVYFPPLYFWGTMELLFYYWLTLAVFPC